MYVFVIADEFSKEWAWNVALRTSSDGLADLIWVEVLVHLQFFLALIEIFFWLSKRIFQKYSPTCRWYRRCTRRETQCSSSQVGLRDSCKPVLLLKPLDLSLKLWSPDQGSLPPPEIEFHFVFLGNPTKAFLLAGFMWNGKRMMEPAHWWGPRCSGRWRSSPPHRLCKSQSCLERIF